MALGHEAITQYSPQKSRPYIAASIIMMRDLSRRAAKR